MEININDYIDFIQGEKNVLPKEIEESRNKILFIYVDEENIHL